MMRMRIEENEEVEDNVQDFRVEVRSEADNHHLLEKGMKLPPSFEKRRE